MAYENKWVADVTERTDGRWDSVSWIGLTNFYAGTYIWTDGTNIYYSDGSTQYVLDKSTKTWYPKTWNGLSSFQGKYIWTDGTDIYYSASLSYASSGDPAQYVLDKSTDTWVRKVWSGEQFLLYGLYVWTDGTNIYYSDGSNQYALDRSTSSWTQKTWTGLTNFDGRYVWTDGENVYYSSSSNQYVLNKSTGIWEPKTWNGLSTYNGRYTWTDGENTYYSYDSSQYVLDKSTSTWNKKTWVGLNYFAGNYIWSDGSQIYYSGGTKQFVLSKGYIKTDIPYRLNFPELQESFNAGGEWLINNDIPYRISSAKLTPSQDYSDLWLTEQDPDAPTSDIEFDPDYRYVKLEFDYTVALNTTLTSESATTDLPNSGINISRGGYYWWQRWLEIRPKTPVASRLYAAEFTIKEDNGLSDYYTNYLVQIDKGYRDGTIQSVSFNMEPRATGYTAEKADLSTNGFAYTSNTNTEYYNNSEAQVANLNNQVGATIILDQNSDEPEVKSGTVTCKLYYCFDSDESGYEELLAAYPNHATPYNPKPATKVPFRDDFTDLQESMAGPDMWFINDDIPYRVQFPEFKSSIPATNAWLILDDIPFRIDFPDLLESVGAPESWLQDNGWEPRRPWPKHKNIILEVQTIEDIPPVDWTKSMIQDFEFYTVDPHTWFDDKKLDNIISCNLTHDATTDKRGNASITLTEVIPECYIRTYLVVTQNGRLYKFCLGTFLYMTSSDSFDGMKHNITMTGYTPLVELEEQYPKLGYHVVGYTNRKYGAEAPMVTNEIRDIILENTRCEVESRVMINKPLLNDFVPGQNDNWLTVVNNMLNASSLQSYILTVDEWGTIIIKDAPTIDDVATSFTYNDDNSSILLPTLDTFDDIYGIPNVMEVLYVGDKNLPAIRVVVKNEDEQSIVSIPRRGREIVKRCTINNIAAPLNDQTYASVYAQVEAQAYKLLEAASTINKTISYSHGYCDVKVGDMVLINYERAGMNNVRAKVVSQRISCKPGCQVDEQAVYTKKLWNRGV